jgi:hypothetical protein
LRQPCRNREAEAENSRQSRTPVWVQVGRIILARQSHAGVGRQTDAGKTEEGRKRLAGRQVKPEGMQARRGSGRQIEGQAGVGTEML